MHVRGPKFETLTRLTGLALAAGLALAVLGAAAPVRAQAQTEEGPSSVQETYRDWIVSCVTPPATEAAPTPARVCEMYQELRQAESNQLVLAIGMQPQVDGDGANLTLVTPFGLLLSAPIGIDVGETRVVDVPFRTCFPQGCRAMTELDAAALDAFAAEEEAQVEMTAVNDQVLSVGVSLAGFTAAWNRLLELRGE